MRNAYYSLKGQRVNGFNSMFAVSSISMAKKYYLVFKKQLEEKNKDLTISTIYSYAANEESYEDGIVKLNSNQKNVIINTSILREILVFRGAIWHLKISIKCLKQLSRLKNYKIYTERVLLLFVTISCGGVHYI